MIKRLYSMWLHKKLEQKQYEDVTMDIIDKLNEIIDWIESNEEDTSPSR